MLQQPVLLQSSGTRAEQRALSFHQIDFPDGLGPWAVFHLCTHILFPKEKHEMISLSRGISAAEYSVTL